MAGRLPGLGSGVIMAPHRDLNFRSGPLPDFWNDTFTSLPQHLQRRLLMGSSGLLHIIEMAEQAINLVSETQDPGLRQKLLALGSDLLLAGFEADPLNASFARQIEMVEKAYKFLPSELKPLISWLLKEYKTPEDQRYLLRLLERREADKIENYLAGQMSKEPGNAFWLHHAFSFGIAEHRLDWLEEQVCGFADLPEQLRHYFLASIAYAKNDWARAAELFEQALQALPLAVWQEQYAQSLKNSGETQKAMKQIQAVVKAHPWQTNSILRLYDLQTGIADRLTAPKGKGAILFYTWNKDVHMDDALRAVFEDERFGAKVFVIDNGSTDDTPRILSAWKERMGDEMELLTFPVNVGAPAARNWLAALPAVRDADWLAYMDDDAVVPEGWLSRFGTAMQVYPNNGVYGCKIIDMHTSMTIQSADFHLMPGEGKMDEGGVVDRKFRVSALQLQGFDFGQFSYLRPCASVTGCCHLFRREFLNRVGGFDLRYSPSQYDDLEHDLRHAMQGELPVYQGHLTVRHAKRTGKDAQMNPSQMSNALGNLMKLQMRYSEDEFNAIMKNDAETALADIKNKIADLGQ